ncbi:pentatricopeptide repeat-containing protein At4g01030, mitochondrial-like [Tasmannia lanceolata]|uniref:pentatricopeptide repeat-containing protein At4g01030, mitochondrial-like n=1 Tax=Tasmannia lanceolata TaxID=3420 RepID=UPI0040642068
MEKTTPFHLNPSLPQNPFCTNKGKRNKTIFHVHGVTDTSFERPPSTFSSLRFSSYTPALDDFMNLKSLDSVKQNHAQIIKTAEVYYSGSSSNRLINLYTEFGDFRSASIIFFMGFERDSLSWSSLIEEFERVGGSSRELLETFGELHRKGLIFRERILADVLRICAMLMDIGLGLEIHAGVIKNGFDSDVHLKCALLNFYVNCCGIDYADHMLSEMSVRNIRLWNEVIMLNSQCGLWLKILELFRKMQFSCVGADSFTITKVLQACGRLGALQEGMQIHGYVIRSALMSNLLVSNSLISMYSKNSKLERARTVFESMNTRTLITWNSMISGYALNGFLDEAMEIFDEMELSETKPDLVTWNCLISGHALCGNYEGILKVLQRMQNEGFKPNSGSITSMLQAVSEFGSLRVGMEIHGCVMRNGLDCDIYVGTSLVDMYVKKGSLANAQSVFDHMKSRNIFVWNSLISGYAYNGYFNKALELLNKMENEGIQPDLITWNGLIYGYAMWGLSERALVLIRQLKKLGFNPNVVSWTALISGCSQNGNYLESLEFFIEMQEAGSRPNSATISSSLQACAGLASLQKGMELHCFAIRTGFDGDIFVATSLIDMYCKSGCLKNAHRVFKKILNTNLATWNAMIMGFSVHGLGKEAISLFNEMCGLGMQPDGITFTALLSGCRHSGLVNDGWKYFDSMRTDYGIIPTLEHYACMVDLLGRGGYLDEAWDFIQTMPLKPDPSVWGALLGACRIHKNLELAEIAAEYLFKLEPYNSGNYLLMMNLYASENRWEDGENLRDMMNVVGVKNRPGWSWIQISYTVHVFSVEGEPHPDIGEIYFELYQLVLEMRKLGYVPNLDCVDQNLDDVEKEKILLSHTEKLAITYGLISTQNSVPIRVIKNTRVCSDCHTAAKYMSQVTSREIFLRDGIRFHHFMDGKCSCNDYW